MAKLTGEEMSRIGQALKQEDFDPAPLLTASVGGSKVKKIVMDDDDFDLNEEDASETSEPKSEPELADPFALVIRKLAASQSPAVKSAIEGTACFARVWYSQEDKDYCPETECGLRQLCETAYHQAVKSVEASDEEVEDINPVDVAKLRRVLDSKEEVPEDDFLKIKQNRKLQGKGKRPVDLSPPRKDLEPPSPAPSVPVRKNVRRPYVNQGRPVDRLANILSDGVNATPLPRKWTYYRCTCAEDRKHAPRWFTRRYGSGMKYQERPSYHTYFYNGMQCMKFWVNAAGGGWLEMNPALAAEITAQKTIRFHIAETPVKNPKSDFNYFPTRIKIRTDQEMEVVVAAVMASLSKMTQG